MVFQCRGLKPLSTIDYVNIEPLQADAIHELGIRHHTHPADAALKCFCIQFFPENGSEADRVCQPEVPYKGDLYVYGLAATFLVRGDCIMCGVTLDESHGDSAGPAEVAVLGLFYDPKGGYSVTPFSINEDGLYATDFETLDALGNWLGDLFCGIQYKLTHRPEVIRMFHHRIPKEEQDEIRIKQKSNNIRIVRVQKVINILAEEDEGIAVIHTTHKINLPVWGVTGHWRQYKSGKRVWIEPYKKGKERLKVSTYVAKEYRFCEEVHDHA